MGGCGLFVGDFFFVGEGVVCFLGVWCLGLFLRVACVGLVFDCLMLVVLGFGVGEFGVYFVVLRLDRFLGLTVLVVCLRRLVGWVGLYFVMVGLVWFGFYVGLFGFSVEWCVLDS